MSKSVRLENWSVLKLDLGEHGIIQRMVGVVYGHPRKRDGSEVITSPVKVTDGQVVVTRSGTRYVLGEPAKEEQDGN